MLSNPHIHFSLQPYILFPFLQIILNFENLIPQAYSNPPSWPLHVSLPTSQTALDPRPPTNPRPPEQLRTTTTDLLKINHPIMLAGMNVAAGPKLAAAVTNAGGLGVIGGFGYTPDMLREQIAELKGFLTDKNAPFGVDLLIPQVGGSARKTK